MDPFIEVPVELIEIIIAYLDDATTIDNLVSVYPYDNLLNWNHVHSVRYGFYENVDRLKICPRSLIVNRYEYIQHIKIYKIKNVWNVDKFTRASNDTILRMTELYLLGERIGEIPKEISILTNLISINLQSNNITQIPKEFFKLNKLLYLSLNSNLITVIPREISKLVNLKKLNLSTNQIREIPKELWTLTNLQVIYLYRNLLGPHITIPDDIINLKCLYCVDLTHNNISQLNYNNSLNNQIKK